MPTGDAKALGWQRALAPQPSVLLLSVPSTAQAALQQLRDLHASFPLVPILVIARFDSDGDLLEALDAGASGYLRETSSASDLIRAAYDLLQGGCVVEPKLAKRILRPLSVGRGTDPPKSAILSCRELEVLRLVATGSPNARIGRHLGLSSATVRTHLERIYQKLHVANRVEAVARSIALGLFQNEAVTPQVRPL
jgi:DNA-binding NarL/FixJ family response regulator